MTTQESEITNDANKAIVRRYAQDVFVGGRLDAIGETIAEGYVHHSASGPDVVGIEAMAGLVRSFRRSFSDISLTVEDMVAEGDRVATRLRIEAIHSGDFGDIPATGRRIVLHGMAIDRIADGKIAEGWEMSDAGGLSAQLAGDPTPARDQGVRGGEADYLFSLLAQRHGDRLSAEELAEVRDGVDAVVKTANELRAVKLGNGDEPVSILRVGSAGRASTEGPK